MCAFLTSAPLQGHWQPAENAQGLKPYIYLEAVAARLSVLLQNPSRKVFFRNL
jgi:hypothetical protein